MANQMENRNSTMVVAIASDIIGEKKEIVYAVFGSTNHVNLNVNLSVNWFAKFGSDLETIMNDALTAYKGQNGNKPPNGLLIMRSYQ